jgi:hypothetical protein
MSEYTVKDNQTGKTVTFKWNATEPPTDADMEQVFEAARTQAPAQEPSPISPVEGASPWPVGSVPTAREMKPYVRGAAQMAVGLPTSIAASPLAGGAAATLAGIGVDAAYGDIGTPGGYAVEGLLNTVLPAGTAKLLDRFGRGAVRSALKIPPTQISAPAAERVVDTAIKENLRVGAGGVAKAEKIIQGVEKQLDDILSKSGSTIDSVKFVQAIDDIRPKVKFSSDPVAANAVLDDVANLAMNHPEVVNGKIPIHAAQQLKKGLYQELKGFYGNMQSLAPKSAIAASTESVGKAAWANSLRNEIMSDPTIPKEATDWLQREANVVNALQWIKRRSNVAANMDPITFNDVLLGGLLREGVPYAVAVRFARSPAVLSQVGIWMAKASPKAAAPLQAGVIGATNLLKQ